MTRPRGDAPGLPPPAGPRAASDAELERELEVLRESYRMRLPAMVERLAERTGRARSSRAPAELADARAEAHRLQGTAGSYGLGVESGLLRTVEEQLDALERGRVADAVAWPAVEEALAKLRARLRAPGA